ncbi:transporter substrate-binding domain-containing protein [Parafrankia elaeagni]|uniref:transporter substrate-binding domain-containing protein n=1 Tax=Parafrankia elaeagni TaxID=222534 RepID=UPI00036924B3|nr:transporter substrate-binding domain-containing protein [Parafrankia elaeagni]
MSADLGTGREPGRRRRARHSRAAALAAAAAVLAATALAACGTTEARFPSEIAVSPVATPRPSPDVTITGSARVPGGGTGTAPGSLAAGGTPRAQTCADGRPVRWSPAPPASMPPPGAFPAGSAMAEIHSRGYLTVAITTDSPPAGSMNWPDLELVGFDVDIARGVAAALFGDDDPGRVRFRPVTTGDRGPLVNDPDSGIDLVVATYTITCERKADNPDTDDDGILFSGVYFESSFKLLVPRNAGLGSIGDLAGLTVCSTSGSTSERKVADAARRALAAGSPPLTVTVRPRAADCLVAVQQGEADAVATDDVILAGMAARDDYLMVDPGAFDEAFTTPAEQADLAEPYGVALRRSGTGVAATDAARDDEFVRFVNGALRDMMRDGRWATSYRTWFEEFLGPRASPLEENPVWPEV